MCVDFLLSFAQVFSFTDEMVWCAKLLKKTMPTMADDSVSVRDWCTYLVKARGAADPEAKYTGGLQWITKLPPRKVSAAQRSETAHHLVDDFLVHPVVVALHRLCGASSARKRVFLAVAPQFGILPWQTLSQTLAAPVVIVPHMQLFGANASAANVGAPPAPAVAATSSTSTECNASTSAATSGRVDQPQPSGLSFRYCWRCWPVGC